MASNASCLLHSVDSRRMAPGGWVVIVLDSGDGVSGTICGGSSMTLVVGRSRGRGGPGRGSLD